MSDWSGMAQQIPLVGYLNLSDPPHLEAHACTSCSAVYLDRRNACARCGRATFRRKSLSNRGRIRAYTVVYRAAPSVSVPYTSVVVDLEGGAVVKANLLDVADPDGITAGLAVSFTTFVAGIDDDGVEAMGFGYRVREVAT